ncbi:hypothetical protein JHK86_000524 [Glycine max]|nr:hypothetical protein JHK86_000524 [Glycine max]
MEFRLNTFDLCAPQLWESLAFGPSPILSRKLPEENNKIDGLTCLHQIRIPVSYHLSDLSTSNQDSCGEVNDDEILSIKGTKQQTELKEANHKVLALEVEVENKNQYCQQLETTCIELQIKWKWHQCRFDSSKGHPFDGSKPLHFSQLTSWKPLDNSLVDPCGITILAEDYHNSDSLYKRDRNIRSHKNQGIPTGYMVRVFQWKTFELSNVLQQFVHDVSRMRDAIKKQFHWDETLSENEAEIGMSVDADKLHLPIEQLSCFGITSGSGEQKSILSRSGSAEKLAERQETILNLGKQFKALAAPKDAYLFDNMLADDDTKVKVSKARERGCSPTSIPGFKQPLEKILLLNKLKGQDDSASLNSMDIVPATRKHFTFE